MSQGLPKIDELGTCVSCGTSVSSQDAICEACQEPTRGADEVLNVAQDRAKWKKRNTAVIKDYLKDALDRFDEENGR